MVKQCVGVILCAVLLMGSAPALKAQDRVSEDELALDQLFMDANKEKLLGNREKAITAFTSILEAHDNHPAAAFELARLYQEADSLTKAISMAELAVEGEQENKWYKMYLGDLYSQTEKHVEAAALYDPLIEREPQNEELYYQKAFFLVKAQELKDALKVYEDLEKRKGLSEEIVRRKHALYLGMGDYKKAANELIKLTQAFPQNVEFFSQLASFYEQIDDQKSALDTYKQILKIDPDNSKAQMVLAGSGPRNTGDVAYLNDLKPIFEDPTVNIDLKMGKIMPLLQKLVQDPNPDLAAALTDMTDLLEQVHSDDAKSFAAAGDVRSLTGQYEAAAEKYIKAIDLDDTVYPVWEQLLFALNATGDAEGLIKYGEYALDIYPNQSMVYYNVALGYLETGDPDEAVSLLRQASMMAGKNETLQQTIQGGMGISYALAGNTAEAENAFKKAIAIKPVTAMTETRYAYFLIQKGQTAEAQKILNKHQKMGQGQPFYVETLAALQAQQNQLTEAAATITRFMDTDGKPMPRSLEFFGDVLFRAGNADRALQFWESARKKGMDSPELQKKISDRKL